MDKKKKIEKYQPEVIEKKWQKKWEEEKIYSPDLDKAKKPFYNLMMFPYPSAEGMHVGNMYAFTGSDIYGRFKRMQGNDTFEPIGLDGFGIHSENYAIKVGRHPKEQAKISEENFYRQLKSIGNSFDWSRKVETYDPSYYKWTQWIFIQLFKKGLAYRKKAPVNFCPSCKTVLADEQVIEGACERCQTLVVKKDLEQWFFKITDYADRLLDGLTHIDWSEKVKIAQKQWIGKKQGINIIYKIENSNLEVVCFTTRPDTNFGATFIVIGPEYPDILKLTKKERLADVKKYIDATLNKSMQDRIDEGRKKTGIFTGSFAINNLNGRKLPVWVGDFVLGDVGTGAVVGVPGHDIRDFEFAKEFDLPVIRVVVGKDGDTSDITEAKQVQEEEGKMVNSDFLNGMDIHKATTAIMDHLEEKGWGKRVTSYHLRDWLISRQRYWGPPIPMVYCEKCEWQPVPDDQLPVLLPDVKDWKPLGSGVSPLANHPEFYETTCPNCQGKARRETDVSDTFLDSAWYFFRYISNEFHNKAFDQQRVKNWLPVDMYIGGAEHSVLHLLYTRFLTMFFKDLGLIDFEEPFKKFRAHGLIIAEGAKMSKSKGNVVNPDKYIKEYGADTLRMYLMFMGPFEYGGDFRDAAIGGIYRFLTRVWQLQGLIDKKEETKEEKVVLNRTIKKATSDLEGMHYNTAIASLMTLLNFFSRQGSVSKESFEKFLILLASFAPHITEELYQRIKNKESRIKGENHNSLFLIHNSIHSQSWPLSDKKYLIEEEISIVIQVNGKVRDSIKYKAESIKNKDEVEQLAKESLKVAKYLEGKDIKKVIYVEGKIINFVTK